MFPHSSSSSGCWTQARTIFRDVFTGIGPEVTEQVEFGAFRKIGDRTTPRKGSV